MALLATSGCVRPGWVELATLNYRAIDPPGPAVARLELDRCYWWTDDDGQVWIAMEREQPSILGPAAKFTFQLSLRLERLPAGHARNYTVDKRELRGLARFGPTQNRFTSLAGIVALYTEPGERLRGSFRMFVARHVARLLGGWGRPSGYLMTGSFTAIHDEQRGRAIAEATEGGGWEREGGGNHQGHEGHEGKSDDDD